MLGSDFCPQNVHCALGTRKTIWFSNQTRKWYADKAGFGIFRIPRVFLCGLTVQNLNRQIEKRNNLNRPDTISLKMARARGKAPGIGPTPGSLEGNRELTLNGVIGIMNTLLKREMACAARLFNH